MRSEWPERDVGLSSASRVCCVAGLTVHEVSSEHEDVIPIAEEFEILRIRTKHSRFVHQPMLAERPNESQHHKAPRMHTNE
jgi:hypothetical protein